MMKLASSAGSLVHDPALCTSCGACVRECHRHLPVSLRGQTGNPEVDCVLCMHCYAVCPGGALRIEGIDPGLEAAMNGPPGIEPDRLLSLFANRRSTRRFRDDPVEPEVVQKLLFGAGLVPSGGGSHSYRFTVLTTGKTRSALYRELEKIYRFRKKLLGKRILRTVFGLLSDKKTRAFLMNDLYYSRVAYLMERIEQGDDPIFYHAPLIIMVHSEELVPTPFEDSILAAYNIVLLAETMGLSSCFVSLAQNAVNTSWKCRQILGLGRKASINAVIVLGYGDVTFHRGVPLSRYHLESSEA